MRSHLGAQFAVHLGGGFSAIEVRSRVIYRASNRKKM